MGEVRARVKLTSTIDIALERRGIIEQSQIRSYEASALVDTGAMSLVIPSFVAEQLGLARTGSRVAEYADGRRDEIDVTEPVSVEIMGRQTTQDALVLGDEVIIGQTILEMTDLLVDCSGRQLGPNPAHPDQPIIKIKFMSSGRAHPDQPIIKVK